MASLTIPEEYLPALTRVASLSADAENELANALETAPLKFYDADLAALVAPSIKLVDRDEVKAILRALSAIAVMAVVTDTPIPEFVVEIGDAAAETKKLGVDLSPEARSGFEARLTRLLSMKSIRVPAKMRSILIGFDNVFCRARTLTDVRPVFGDSPDLVEAVIAVHTLRVTYHHGVQMRDFFVKMDTDDLEKLIETLQRAKVKSAALKSVIQATKIPFVDVE